MNGPESTAEERRDVCTDGPTVIMVGMDGSDTSMRAVAYAVGLARRQGARLVVAQVLHPSSLGAFMPEASSVLNDALNQAADQLRAQVEVGVASVGMTAEFRAASGNPFTELARIADEIRADGVVLGASAHAGHRLVGSLAVRMVRAGRWPVTVVP